jgi:hypothetical protein
MLTVTINFRWICSLIKEWTLKSFVLLQSARISWRLLKDGRILQVWLLSILNRKETGSFQLRNWHRYGHPSFYENQYRSMSFWYQLVIGSLFTESREKKNSQIAYFKNAKKTRQKVEISKRQKTSLLMPNGH